ncbi:hypothetical protein QE385_002322 [Sphingomonas sp. SORGH_AS 950]|uniref:hypothetical protein n=1 Tax=Sphingomonas sp. SORGH_AS_0950 TaxID=3041792 RepID=UPI002785A09A|nr:hypothetical protein [Sphingomonas sp. SORGH_AS_0950]MDQ1157995.1 hypothetical protein [Sphingomonas sp. SORGH_AS_0950]
MMANNEQGGRLDFVDGCVRTYGAATRFIGELYLKEGGQEMPTLSGPPKQRYQDAVSLYGNLIRGKAGRTIQGDLKSAAAADPALADLLSDSAAVTKGEDLHDIDDVPPNVFKDAIYAEAADRARKDAFVDMDLTVFLRNVVARTMDGLGWRRRLNVGANRHFPRMLQWLREVEEETLYDRASGLRLMNRGGGGRVASEPGGPDGLKVRLNADLL